jgi:hypothetical protein
MGKLRGQVQEMREMREVQEAAAEARDGGWVNECWWLCKANEAGV